MPTSTQSFLRKFSEAFLTQEAKQWAKYGQHYVIDDIAFQISASSHSVLKHTTRALAHLEVPAKKSTQQLSLYLHTGYSPAIRNFLDHAHQSAGNKVIRLQNDTCMFMYNPGLEQSIPTLSFLDRQSSEAVFWIDNTRDMPWYEIAAPFRTIFHWFFADLNMSLVHGACIGTQNKGIVLTGKGGVGKTSTALTFLHHPELVYVADDYFLLKMQPRPQAFSLFSSTKADPETLSRFPMLKQLQSELAGSSAEKTAIFFYPEKSDNLAKHLPIAALVAPKVTHARQSTFRASSSSEALIALAPSTIFQLQPESPGKSSFTELAELTKRVPSFELHLGTHPAEIADGIVKFIEQL